MKTSVSGASVSALAIAIATPAVAQDTAEQPAAQERQGGVQTIVVTAQKRSEDLQDVPVSVAAIGAEQLEELAIDTFEDYLEQLPTVTAGGSGPGQSTIYIRGLASTTPNLTTAGVAGLAPNVALYLDEQPLAQPGRNLDVYAADMERIEVLSGPQGTLFGASSQAGVVRLITAKPSLSGFDMSVGAGLSFTKGGEASYKGEVMVNLPVADTLALRAVAFYDHQGGYIDNVPGTRDLRESARFRPEGTVRSNGVPVNALRAGFQADADLSDVTFIEANNADLVEDDFNDTQYVGFRGTALWEITPEWNLTVAHTRQQVDSDGVFFADPELDGLDDLEIQRFEDDTLEDEFSNTSWTIEGRLAALDLVYTGAYTDRTTEQVVDYTDYLFVGQYLPYYICDGSVSYPGGAEPSGTCYAPDLNVVSLSNTRVFTNEFRFSTDADNWVRTTGGVFFSDLELEERNDFNYSSNTLADPFGAFAPNFPFPGFNTDPGPFAPETIFRNDIRRTDKQFGIFGETSVDIVPDLLTITGGIRYYNVRVDFEGSANSSFWNSGAAEDANAFGTNISDLYDGDGQYTFIGSCNAALRQTFTINDSFEDIRDAGLSIAQARQVFNAVRAPDEAKAEGVIYKGTLTLTPTPDLMFYATYSEGFRPGLLNRPGGATNGAGFVVPFELDTDEVKNYELGWKTELADGQVRFNGSAFYVDISRLQTTIFDPSITNLFFSANAADAEIKGVEADFTFAPYAMPGLTLSGAFSILDTEITEVLIPTSDLAFMDRVHLSFALGKAYEDREDFEQSFRYYEEGNALKRAQTRYSADAMTKELASQAEVCTSALFDTHAGAGHSAPDAIFILGLPRAGSTLLEQILASHSQVDGTLELPNILALAHRLRGRKAGRSRYPQVLHDLTREQLAAFGRKFIEDTRVHRQGAPFFIDKMPNNFRHIGLIHLILPNAKIIDARRAPMDCCFSGFKQLFAEGQEFTYGLTEVGRYYSDYVALMDHWDRVLPGKVLRVDHEDVLGDLEGQTRRMLEYCGLPFEEACLDFHKTERAVRTASSEQVRRPINRKGQNAWKPYEPWLDPLKHALDPKQR